MLGIFKKETPTVIESASNIKDLAHDGQNYYSEELILLGEVLTGNLFCAEKVSIEQHGVLTGNITSKLCTVAGQVNGDILSLDLLDIRATAIVRGNIQSAKVNIEPGAVINGYITVGEDIEALTEQWNKTKFSTDEHLLTDKLNKELHAINSTSKAAEIIVQKEADKQTIAPSVTAGTLIAAKQSNPLTAAQSSSETKQEPTAHETPVSKPTLAAAAPPQKAEPLNNERWW